jgi:hypothetical protein
MDRSLIPLPRLQAVNNDTPFQVFDCDKMGVGRRYYDTVVVKGTFALSPGKLELAEEQEEIRLGDELWDPDNPERSSVKHEGDVVLTKPSTDIIVTGTAHAPGGEPLPDWDAAIEVRGGGETKVAYRAQALGLRRFRHTTAKGWSVTDPEPTLYVPIRYELAYGGAYRPRQAEGEAPLDWVVCDANPSGTGFCDESQLDPAVEYLAPSWQPRAHPVTGLNHEVPLTGFGPVARAWTSRRKYAGTYDDAWLRKTRDEVAHGLPTDYAADFDPRFFQCAHPELIASSYLVGSEEIVLTGLMPGREPYTLELPGMKVIAELRDGKDEVHPEELCLDTVHLDLDRAIVSVCWRLTLDQAWDIQHAALFVAKAGEPARAPMVRNTLQGTLEVA